MTERLLAGLRFAFLVFCFSTPAFAQHRDSHDFDPPFPAEQLPTVDQQQGQPTQQPAQAPAPAAAKHDDDDDKKAKLKWDVNFPPGPRYDVAIDTDEGTWMNVDVSPDGKEIAFDMLGDIYVMPIGGGEAKSLTSGVAWDMQPRFSPDGKWIAFTSDRAGGDNIWIMRRDGSQPQQVSKESFRLLNSPAWSPDSEFILARKHFTSTRSLGSGEIWMYHRSGGEGLQLTKKPNDQKDVGEPMFSRDGRYIFYSQDVTPGTIFEYNKNPNDEIYAINRLDRVTGDSERYIQGPGGAIRPTPSPDGRYLAFIRRVDYKSVLHLMDLKSGEIRPVYGMNPGEALERDMQETWAIHGVYPVMGWTPDSKSIVFWAKGKIQRFDLGTMKASVIPFHVKTVRSVAEALHSARPAAQERFPVKMLRWVSVSPKGDRVLYSALGYIYVRPLPEGEPKRLTTQTDHFEYFPQWSRDGSQIVYVAWNDDKLGSVRVIDANGGSEGRTVTTEPGHYFEPTFSPDGQTIVFRKGKGGGVVSDDWSLESGLYAVPAKGGKPAFIVKRGMDPQFGATNDRVYYVTIESENKRAFRSSDLNGGNERTHLNSNDATEFRLSPDEKWISFIERFNVYIAPFVRTGATVDIGPDQKGMPMVQASKDAGEWVHWSGDSRKLYWALGPRMFERQLPELFSFFEGGKKEIADSLKEGTDIGFDGVQEVPKGSIAFVGGRVVTMKGDEVIENGTVVVENNRIKAVGPNGKVAVPAGATRIDAKGMTILPGLIDAHWHGAQGANDVVPQRNYFNYSSLTFGVTTIHDPSNVSSTIFTASEMGKVGNIVGPRIFSTGTILYGAKAPFKAVIENADDARATLRRMNAIGAFSVKSYNQPRRDQRQQIITAARELNMLVVPEGGSLFQHNMTMLIDGHTTIEHSLPVPEVYKDVKQLWSKVKTFYNPTLIVAYGGMFGEEYWYQHTDVYKDQRLLNYVPKWIVDARARRRNMAPEEEFNHIHNAHVVKELGDAGVVTLIGAHGQREGLGAHWELWAQVQGGMTPLQAIRSATINGARMLGMEADLGSIEPGKLADIIVLDKNPLQDIRNSESIKYTMVNGHLYVSLTLNQIAPEKKPRGKMWWEQDGKLTEGVPAQTPQPAAK